MMKESRYVNVELHSRYAFQVMHELRTREELCDVVLCIDGAKFKAHKIILAGCSPYLRAMFTNGMLETEKNLIEIHGIENATMELLLEFMYTGSIELTVENVQNILQGASLLGLLSLRNLAAQFLQSQLEPSNCLGIQYFADMYMCGELERAARNYIYQNFRDVIRTDEFLQLSEEKLFSLLKSDKLRVTSEHQVLEAALSWIQWDPRNRTDSACQLLEHIKLALLEDSYLEDVVLQSEFVRNCPKCQFLISKAILTKQDDMTLSLVTPRPQPPSIYVVGGRNNTHCQLKTMERYDFLQDKWETVALMNIARTAVGTANLDGLLYVVGGECALVDMQEHTLYLRSMEVYDPTLRDWIPMPEMKVARSFIAVVAVGRILYAIGGEDRSCSFDLVEKYDPRTKTWSVAPSMRRRRSGAGVALCDNKIYVAGGYDKTLHTDRASVECFDLETQEWLFVAEMEKARSGLSLVAVDQNLYAFGGRFRHTEQYFDLVERYNTMSQQWTTITSMNTPRAWPGVAKFEGRIYVIGGFDGSNRLRSVEVYDPETNKWTYISSMMVGRAGCGSAAI